MGRYLTGNAYVALMPTGSSTLNVVDEYGDLPLASEHSDEIYHVKTTTGTLFVDRKRSGQYISNGSDWIFLSALQNIEEIDWTGQGGKYLKRKADNSGWEFASPAGTGDMEQANYDSNSDNKVNAADTADSVPWSGITGIPDMFTPDAHTHSMTEVIDLPDFENIYSQLGHTHVMSEVDDLPTFGNAVGLNLGTGSNEIAEGNHNHNLAELAEKSYDSLTDKPTIPNESDLITKATLLANSIAAAVTAANVFALQLTEGTVVGRALGGNVTALSLDIDLASTSASDDTIPSAKAVKSALDGKLNTKTIGIANDNLVEIDDASVNSGEYAKFTSNGIEGVTLVTMAADLGTNLHNIYIENAPADDTMQGLFITLKAGEALAYRDVCYQTGGKMSKADADAWASAGGFLFLCAETAGISANATGKFLFIGLVRDDSVSWTADKLLALSTTAGALTETIPSGEDDVVKIPGQQLTEDTNCYFFCGLPGGIEYDAT